MRILMVVTSHDTLGDTGRKTGAWLEEIAAPWAVFKDAGADIVFASPKGGPAPIDPGSEKQESAAVARFRKDAKATAALAKTRPLADVLDESFDAVFFPGGHGPLWDLAEDRDARRLIESMYAQRKPIGTVCHGAAVFRHARGPFGMPLVRGRKVTGFSNTEEAAAGLTESVPFLIEDMLKENAGHYSKVADFQPHVVSDGHVVTGQNPASSEGTAHAVLDALARGA